MSCYIQDLEASGRPIRVGDAWLRWAIYEHTPLGCILLGLCPTQPQALLLLALLTRDRRVIHHERLHPLRPSVRRRTRRNRPKRH